MKKLLLITMLFVSLFAEGQSLHGSAKNPVEVVLLPQVGPETIRQEENKHKGSPLLYFAVPADVNYNLSNSGTWTALENGDRVWQIHFASPGAKNLHFWIRNLTLPEGATITVYPEGGRKNADIYDLRNVGRSDYFGIWPVHGDDVWIEYYEPAKVAGTGQLEIFKAGIGYKSVFAMGIPEPPSLECNYDVECYMEGIENLKNHSKKSVALILGGVEGEGGIFLASGALVNNTANDGKPYILSANHAWVENAMYTFRFNWRNPDPDCPSSGWGDQGINPNNTVSGATLRARRPQSDFMLLEINSELPEEWDLVWSGWDRSAVPPPYTYCIHHPAGDIMKICRDYNSPEILDEDNGDLKWLINHWELGTTEGGSSGSPLLTDHGRIIGQLWAGASACIGSEPNGAGDVYGRFDVSWDAGDTPASRLKEWLDPENTGALTTDFYPPLPVYALDGEIKFIEEGSSICGTGVEPVIRLINNGTAEITSASVAYTMNDGEPVVIDWEGSLELNEADIIYLPPVEGGDGENTFTISLLSINGQTDENGDNNSLDISFTKRVYETNEIVLQLLSDNYGDDITWELTNENGAVVESGGPYVSNQFTSQTFEVPDGCYLFTMHDSYGDGICCSQGNGLYTLMAGDIVIKSDGDYGSISEVNFMLNGGLGLKASGMANMVVYPNPSQGLFTVSLKDSNDVTYRLYNTIGQELMAGTFEAGENTLDISGMAQGVYLLEVTDTAGKIANSRIMKQ